MAVSLSGSTDVPLVDSRGADPARTWNDKVNNAVHSKAVLNRTETSRTRSGKTPIQGKRGGVLHYHCQILIKVC